MFDSPSDFASHILSAGRIFARYGVVMVIIMYLNLCMYARDWYYAAATCYLVWTEVADFSSKQRTS